MKNLLYNYLLKSFILASFFLGGFIIGPFSVRIYLAVIILIILFIKGCKFPKNKEIYIYGLFLLLYIFALVANGGIIEINFLKVFLGSYFICFIAFYAVFNIVKTEKELCNVIKFIFIIGIINSIISILQYFGNSFAISIPSFLNPTVLNSEKLEKLNGFIQNNNDELGSYGFFTSSVTNGYFSIIPCVLVLYYYEVEKIFFKKIFFIICAIISIFGLFVVQQRFVAILVLIFYLYFLLKKAKYLFTFLILFLFLLGYVTVDILDFKIDNLGRLSSLEDKNRESIFSDSIDFISDNILFGGQFMAEEYLSSRHRVNSSHNFFLNAFIYSGLIGGIVVIYLYFLMLLKSFRALNKINQLHFYLASILIIILLNSLTHNKSLVTGDETIWIFYVLMIISIRRINPKKIT